MSRNVFEIAKAERERQRKPKDSRAPSIGGGWSKRVAAEMRRVGLAEDAWISVAEAARRLGLNADGLYNMLRKGLMQSRMVAGRRLVPVSSVEWECARRNARAAKRSSETTNCEGQFPKQKAGNSLGAGNENKSVSRSERRSGMKIEGIRWIDYDKDDIWAPAFRACQILCLTPNSLNQMAQRGRLQRRWADKRTMKEIENPMGPGGRRLRTRSALAMFSLNELNRLASARESKAWARGRSPNNPERSLKTSYIRTSLVPPPGDSLITRAEAAAVLNVTTMRISTLVSEGTLFGWQTSPRKPGCPLYLSLNQVTRFSRNEEHLRRRNKYLQVKAGKHSAKPGYRPNDLQERLHLWEPPAKALQQNHREFYSTLQAAAVLGVTRGRVLDMRNHGILKGYRSVHSNEKFNRRRHWFFKKDDVDALKLNSAHIRRRKAYWKARMPWAYGEESTEYLGPSTENGGPVEEEWFPHQVDHSPSPAAKMKMEMEGW